MIVAEKDVASAPKGQVSSGTEELVRSASSRIDLGQELLSALTLTVCKV